MRTIARVVGLVALLGTIAPPAAYLAGSMSLESMKTWLLVFTVVWFIVAPVADRQTKLEKIVEESGGEVVP